MDASFVADILRGGIKRGGRAGKRVWHFRPAAGARQRKFPGNSIEPRGDSPEGIVRRRQLRNYFQI